ncbi:unnamed protein product [Bemisia tabaci]|uniref:MADF domain-containing protein n=1 Tax=Bemisia tabaci TaxID=7038 RepID=A0A9P0A5A0_BEMTA|nr:unnamed protein product [Bemisia tabaci]
MEDEVLIEKVRAFPHLYDPQDAAHLDQKKIKNSWEAIGKAPGASAIPNLLLTASVDIPESHKSTKVISYYKRFLGQR